MKAAVINVIAGGGNSRADFELTTANHLRYAEKCHADYQVVDLDWPADHTYCWWKYEAATMAAQYDVSIYADNDCIFTRQCPDFRTAVPAGHWGVVDELWTLRKQNRETLQQIAARIPATLAWQANGGVLIMPTEAAKVYHREDWLEPDWVTDQMLLSWRLDRKEAPYRLLDRRWNFSYMRFWDFEANRSHAWVIHHAGHSHYEDYHRKRTAMAHDLEVCGL
jgi:hypothetical protein